VFRRRPNIESAARLAQTLHVSLRPMFRRVIVFLPLACATCEDSGDSRSEGSSTSRSTTSSGAGGDGAGGAGGTGHGPGAHTSSGAGGDAGGGGTGGGNVDSTVVVIPDCVGVDDVAVELSTTELNEFTIDGTVGFSLSLVAGDVVRFSTGSDHNFESVPGTPPQFFFKSGAAVAHVACLRFTAATQGPIGFECDPHTGDGMVGTLTVE
jgi:plastocyanin